MSEDEVTIHNRPDRSYQLIQYDPAWASRFDEVVHGVPTTPRGRDYDHVLFAGARALESRVSRDVLTDHYPVISTLSFH